MPQVEIDEAELLRLRRTAGTVNDMLNKSPSTKRKLLEALKDVRPDDPSVKELDLPDPVADRFSALEKQNADLRAALEADKTERDKNAKLDGIKAEQERGYERLRAAKWTAEGIDKVKKVMEEKGILDVDVAAAYIESQSPPQQVAMPGSGGGWNFLEQPAEGGDADIKALIESKGENDGLLMKMSRDAISDVRGASARR